MFAEAHRFETLRLLRRDADGQSTVTAVDGTQRQALEADRGKLLPHHDASRSEGLFADGVLLVEGPGDQLAIRELAAHFRVDLDAENLSVIACGGKTAIPYHARLYMALGIPVCVLYDDDLVPDPDAQDESPAAAKARSNNRRARRENAAIVAAVPSSLNRFMCSPSLEAELSVTGGRDKPARVAAAVREAPTDAPDALRRALLRLADFVEAGPAPF